MLRICFAYFHEYSYVNYISPIVPFYCSTSINIHDVRLKCVHFAILLSSQSVFMNFFSSNKWVFKNCYVEIIICTSAGFSQRILYFQGFQQWHLSSVKKAAAEIMAIDNSQHWQPIAETMARNFKNNCKQHWKQLQATM